MGKPVTSIPLHSVVLRKSRDIKDDFRLLASRKTQALRLGFLFHKIFEFEIGRRRVLRRRPRLSPSGFGYLRDDARLHELLAGYQALDLAPGKKGNHDQLLWVATGIRHWRHAVAIHPQLMNPMGHPVELGFGQVDHGDGGALNASLCQDLGMDRNELGERHEIRMLGVDGFLKPSHAAVSGDEQHRERIRDHDRHFGFLPFEG